MINHIVMWKLKSNFTSIEKQDASHLIKKKLEYLPEKISQIVDLHVGVNIENPDVNYDVVLFSVFDNMSNLDTYQNHPEHQKVASMVKSLSSERACVDYESP